MGLYLGDMNKIYFHSKTKTQLLKRRDYHQKKLANPFFLKDKKKSVFWVNLILTFIIFFGIYYFIEHTSILQIQGIKLNGANSLTTNLVAEIAQIQQKNKRIFIFTQDKIIFFNIKELKKNISKQILFEKFEVKKDYRDRLLIINIQERISFFYLHNQGHFFTLDNQGNLINIIDKLPEPLDLPLIEFSTYNLSIGASLSEPVLLAKLNEIYNKWAHLIINNNIKSFELEENISNIDKIIINTQKGFKVYLNKNQDIAKQIETTRDLLTKLEQENIKISEYLDLSVAGWIYYK